MQWYYSKNGAQLGPIGDQEIKAKVASGEVAPTDLVWREGMGDWMPASQVQELRPSTVEGGLGSGFPSPPGHTPAYPDSPSTVRAPAYPQQGVAPPSQGMALGSLICGIIGLLGCWAWCLSLPLAIVAIVLGHVALSKIKANPAVYTGRTSAKLGLVMGYVGVLLSIIVLILAFWVQSLSPQQLEEFGVPQELRDEFIRQREARQMGTR